MKKVLKYIMIGVFAFILVSLLPVKAKAAISDNHNGTVTVNFTNDTTLRIKIQVIAGDYKQTYDLPSGVSVLVLPLTAGNTTYTVRVMRQTEPGTNKYSVVEKTEVSLNLSDKNQVYLYSNAIVGFKQSDNILKRASELTHGCQTEAEVVAAVHNWIVKYFVYNYDLASQISAGTVTSYVPDVQSVYKAKTGICYDYSVVMASMLRSRGIEVRVITGYPDPSMVNGYHAWLQIYDPTTKSWYTCDPTYDSCYYHKGYKYDLKKPDSKYSNITYIY
ncbi:MAG: transglutaminase domain-containing protein [Lachnospiraceae bacterium]|nr:transglutaminase domain-containing protein [Lachnospiraceae bacterium]